MQFGIVSTKVTKIGSFQETSISFFLRNGCCVVKLVHTFQKKPFFTCFLQLIVLYVALKMAQLQKVLSLAKTRADFERSLMTFYKDERYKLFQIRLEFAPWIEGIDW